MRTSTILEPIPGPLPEGDCTACGRRRIPYLLSCLCGQVFEPDLPDPAHPPSFSAAREPGIFRIAHWSDLHVGARTPTGVPVEPVMRAMLRVAQKMEVDALIISGDISKFAHPTELMTARKLLDAYGYGPGHRILVPGNHDIPRNSDSTLFNEIFEVNYPLAAELGPGVWVAAFDSNVLDRRMLFERQWVAVRGRVGQDALRYVRDLWQPLPTGSRILVVHHHIARLTPESRWMAIEDRLFKVDRHLMAPLLDSEEVLKFANELKFTAVLHGHKHWYSRTGYRVDSIPVFNAGSITRMVRPVFRVFDFRDGTWDRLIRVELTL